jgi:phosphoglycolate phosphatase-like HAD superfamily hydrolase
MTGAPDVPLIGFDLDGTLITCRAKQLSALREALQACGVEYASDDAFWRLKRDGATTIDALVATGIEEARARAVSHAWVERVETWPHMQCDELFAGVVPLLERLKSRSRLLLLSARREPDLFRRQVSDLGIAQLFDFVEAVQSGNEAAQRKALRLRAHGAACYVGDTESDMDAAEQAGVPMYVVSTGQRSRSYLERAAARRQAAMPIFEELAGAIHEVEREFLS